MNIFTFMGEHPILTFFLAIVLGDCIVRTTAAIRGHLGSVHCGNCSPKKEDD